MRIAFLQYRRFVGVIFNCTAEYNQSFIVKTRNIYQIWPERHRSLTKITVYAYFAIRDEDVDLNIKKKSLSWNQRTRSILHFATLEITSNFAHTTENNY